MAQVWSITTEDEDMYRKNPSLMENQLTGYDEAGKNVEKNDRQIRCADADGEDTNRCSADCEVI